MCPVDAPSRPGYKIQFTKKRSTALVSRSRFKGSGREATARWLSHGYTDCRSRAVPSETGVEVRSCCVDGPGIARAPLPSCLASCEFLRATSRSSRNIKSLSAGSPEHSRPLRMQRPHAGRLRSHCSCQLQASILWNGKVPSLSLSPSCTARRIGRRSCCPERVWVAHQVDGQRRTAKPAQTDLTLARVAGRPSALTRGWYAWQKWDSASQRTAIPVRELPPTALDEIARTLCHSSLESDPMQRQHKFGKKASRQLT